MIKKILLLFILTLSLHIPLKADYCPCNSLYLKVFGGANALETSENDEVQPYFHPGYVVAGALGYHWNCGLNIEAEYAYRRNTQRKFHYFGQDFDISGSSQTSSYMANLIWDICFWKCFFGPYRPFFGAGVGYDVQRFHTSQDDFIWQEKKKGFAWQLIAGIKCPLFCHSEIAVEYRFHKGPLSHFYNHAVGLSLNYNFML